MTFSSNKEFDWLASPGFFPLSNQEKYLSTHLRHSRGLGLPRKFWLLPRFMDLLCFVSLFLLVLYALNFFLAPVACPEFLSSLARFLLFALPPLNRILLLIFPALIWQVPFTSQLHLLPVLLRVSRYSLQCDI